MSKFNTTQGWRGAYIGLTDCYRGTILSALSPHVAVGIGLSCKGENSPLLLTVFFRSLFSINMELIRVQFIMVDCFREALKSFARSFAGRPTSFNPPPLIGLIGGGKPSNKGVTA